ncbi:MAG TPA: hypothetical protein PLQ88_01840 [Blastocatellia bacterium]|nr:hypothetical protein [Blastocatellia bacterium]HMY70545.1 hypothetical protein [Blastocatellia bacterium]
MSRLPCTCFCEIEKPMFSLAGARKSAGEGGKSAAIKAAANPVKIARSILEERYVPEGALLGFEIFVFQRLHQTTIENRAAMFLSEQKILPLNATRHSGRFAQSAKLGCLRKQGSNLL